MAAVDGAGVDGVMDHFYRRASEAEERLERLEAVVARKQDDTDTSNREFSSVVSDFKSKLEVAQNELKSVREKASQDIQKLMAENAKLQYRILHLIRAVRDAENIDTSNKGA